ncbi:MAG TPA: hypothetical protein VFA94_09115 [Acidimicrobiales bacterium]|nr:hypothetical protein [Acidimicrobiales bacterium]
MSPIEKGSPYGEAGAPLPAGGVVVGSDAEARAVLEAARRENRPYPPLQLTGGDLCRTLGGPAGGDVSFSVDLGEVLIDGRLCLFVAHLVARTRLWGFAFVAMNAQWLGGWNLGPRAHPGDGLLDTYSAALSAGERLQVRRRLPHGAHLPHPGIKEQRTAAISVELPRALPVVLDGSVAGVARSLALRVEPDALTVVV